MRWRMLRISLGVAVVALAVTAGASSYPNQGITVSAAPVTVALKALDRYSGVATLTYTTAARWNPEASQEDVTVFFKDVTDGTVQRAKLPPCCNRLHSSNLYTDIASGFKGHKMEFIATWTVYNVGGDSGERTSPKTTYTIPREEPAPRLTDEQKKAHAEAGAGMAVTMAAVVVAVVALGIVATPLGAGIAIWAALHMGLGLYFQKLALDPVDMNFRSIAKPKIPAIPKISPGEGLPAAAARALNDLFAVQARELGYARAVATAFDRSQGAYVKKATDWEKKQVRAAGKYASQLASALLAEASLRPRVKAALAGSALADGNVTYEDAFAFGESLVWEGLPAQVTAQLGKLGLTKAEQREIRAQVATIDPGLYDGDVLDFVAKPKDIATLRRLAAGLKAFAKAAAKNPLATRPP